ncbi:hypothetical protein ACF0H5_012302 [Mactra antiquata]
MAIVYFILSMNGNKHEAVYRSVQQDAGESMSSGINTRNNHDSIMSGSKDEHDKENLLNNMDKDGAPEDLMKFRFDRFAISAQHHLNRERLVRDVDCKAIIDGERVEIAKADFLSGQRAKLSYDAQYYIQLTSKCSDFMLNREYITSSLTDEEKDFPIAYSILMYKSVEQSERLLRTIYRPQNIYCIHVDAKSEYPIFKAMKSIADCFDNVFVLEERYIVKWGTFSVLEPELQCMRMLWRTNQYWKYFINLTGQEFPLRTNYDNENIRYSETIPPPHGIVATKGDVHIVASRGYVNFILHDPRAQDLLEWVRQTPIPDETFFSTLNHNRFLNVPGSYNGTLTGEYDQMSRVKPFLARYKLWRRGSERERFCTGKVVRDICVFGIGELQYLAYAKELFANKFYLDYKHYALDCMEELIYNRTRDEYLGILDFDSSWYSKLEFVTNKRE